LRKSAGRSALRLAVRQHGRLISTTEDLGWGPQPAASAQYGPAGELLNLSYFGINEKRAYNSLLQVIHMTATPQYGPSVMDMQYNYSATLNNGRIVSSNDYVTGENVSYTYDALNRLTVASAGSMWGETYTYDGFGNLTGKSQARHRRQDWAFPTMPTTIRSDCSMMRMETRPGTRKVRRLMAGT